MSLSNIGSELSTIITDAGETFVLADSVEFTGIWSHFSNDEGNIRGGQTTVQALSTDTACISIGDSIYREADEPPVEYKVRDRTQDDLGFVETLTLEKQD